MPHRQPAITKTVMTRHILHIIFSLSLVLTWGCSDSNNGLPEVAGGNKEVTLTLRLPGFIAGSRAIDENGIATLRVLFFDGDGNYISETAVNSDKISATALSNSYKVKLPIESGASTVHLVANYDNTVGADPAHIASAIDPNTTEKMVFWGSASVDDLKKPNSNIAMTRMCAKTELKSKIDGFNISQIKFYGAPESGTLAPVSAGILNLPDDISYNSTGIGITPQSPYYHYEAPAGRCFIIIKASYKGIEGYYKVSYIKAGEDNVAGDNITGLPILRNHRYQFTISGVNDCGWPTEQQAIASQPDNRLTVLLKDDDESIHDMISCRDYELGVCDTVRVGHDATAAEITFVTSYNGSPAYSLSIPETDEWISSPSEKSMESLPATDTRSDMVRYTVELRLLKNDHSEQQRETAVTVRSGDLSRQVVIRQDGANLKRDPSRQVLIYNLEQHNTGGYPYFTFIDEELKGATKEEMRVERNNGLHFAIYGNRYYYSIPYVEGDRVDTSHAPNVSVTHEGDKWVVRCSNHIDYDLWDGFFIITNPGTTRLEDIRITYPVFHRGLFHQLKGSRQIAGPTGGTAIGWYYYEQVTITGNGGKTYHILDRNMGASSNRFYSPSGVNSSMNTGATGGFFRIADAKSDMTLIAALPPEGYSVPISYHLKDIGINVKNDQEGTVYINTAGNNNGLPEIYIPLSGYMEGNNHKDEVHACLWSQSLLSGNQGFSTDSPEYGYWFLYLNVYGNRINLSNMRITTRSNEASFSLPKAMPVRCLHGPGAPDGSEIQPTEGRHRIYCTNSAGWTMINVHCWREEAGKDEVFTVWPGPAMSRTNDGKYYFDVPDRATHIKFSANGQPKSINLKLEDGRDTYDNNIPDIS